MQNDRLKQTSFIMKYHIWAMRLIALFLVAATVTCCTDNGTDDDQTPPPPAGGKEKIQAKIVCPDSDSGSDCMDSYWTAKGSLDVFTKDARSKYTFLGKTGDFSGEFAKSKDYDKVECEYQGAYAMTNCKGYDVSDGALRLQYTVSSSLQYTKNKFNNSFNVLYGTSDDGEEFEFSSLLGVLQVGVTGTDILKSITLKGNNKESIAGTCYLNVNSPKTVTFKSKSDEITLHGGKSGETLSITTATVFNFMLPPTTFSKGFTLTLTYIDESTYEIVYSESCTVKRNHVCKIPTLSSIDPDLQLAAVTFTGKSLLLPTFSTDDTPIYGTAIMGDGSFVSLETFTSYDYAKEAEYTATFKIKKASTIKFENLEGISKINLSNF